MTSADSLGKEAINNQITSEIVVNIDLLLIASYG